MSAGAPLRLHLVRHGKIESHRGDMPLIDEGLRQAEAFGQRLNEELVIEEVVSFLYAPTRRARETTETIYNALRITSGYADSRQTQLLAPVEHCALRNPDIYVAGSRIELVSTPEAVAEQLPGNQVRPGRGLRDSDARRPATPESGSRRCIARVAYEADPGD